MTITPAPSDLNRIVSENLTTLLFRLGWKQNTLAARAHMNAGTLGRKMKGLSDWTVPEVANLAKITGVDDD